MRLFAALDLPDDIRHELSVWWTAACVHLPPAQWRDVPRHHWHITLAFYGDVEGDEVDGLAEALAECAASTSPIGLSIEGCGAFPHPARPRVFWAGVEQQQEGKDLRHLARCCRQAGHVTLRKHTAKSEPFRGHITLARAALQAVPLDVAIWQALPDFPVLEWSVGSFSLYASTLRPQGPLYRLVEAFEFKGNHHVR